jgi:hypothetical protein
MGPGGMGMGMGIDCTMRILDGRRSLACLLGRLGLMVWSLGIWFGLVWFLVFFFGFSTGAGGFIFSGPFFLFDAATLGLDWTFLVHIPACVRLLFFSFERH